MLLKDAIIQFDNTLERLGKYISAKGVAADANTDTLSAMADKVLKIGIDTGIAVHVEEVETHEPLETMVLIQAPGEPGTPSTVITQGKSRSGVFPADVGNPGLYIARFMDPLPGYVNCGLDRMEVSVGAGQMAHAYLAQLKVRGILISPVSDSSNDPIPGCVAEVYDAAGNKVYTGTTNEYGYSMTGSIPDGNYTVKLIEWPGKYNPQTNETQVTVTGGAPVTAEFRCDILNALVITLTDGNGTPLAGGVFEVQDLSTYKITTLTTGSDGKATYYGKPGFYGITQKGFPEGYVISGNEFQFAQITSSGPALINYTNTKA